MARLKLLPDAPAIPDREKEPSMPCCFREKSTRDKSLFAGLLLILLATVAPQNLVAQATATKDAEDGLAGLGSEEGLPVVPWDQAGRVKGRMAIVYGQVFHIGHAKTIHFINFSRERGKFTAVVFDKALKKSFEGKLEDAYLNKRIKIRGVVSEFKGEPQIVVSHPDQIVVVDKFPEMTIPDIKTVRPGNELVVGTFNIKNLFDNEDDPYHNDETTETKPRDDMKRAANVIRDMDCDVLALQEVENRGYLERFINSMLPEMGYRHIVLYEGNDGRGIDVCVISRVPVGEVVSNRHRVFPAVDGGQQRFNRDLLMVELEPENGDPFEMWVVHLKSNSGGKPQNEPIRLGECNEIRRIIESELSEDPDSAFVLCGDFNDTFETKTIQTILGSKGSSTSLIPLIKDIPEGDRITYNREPHRSMIDFLLCSPAMAKRYVKGTAKVRLSEESESGSDHNPVFCRFRKSSGANAAKVGNAVRPAASVSSAISQ